MDYSHLFEKIDSTTDLKKIVNHIFDNNPLSTNMNEQFLSILCHIILKDNALIPAILAYIEVSKAHSIKTLLNGLILSLNPSTEIKDIKYKLIHGIELSENDLKYFVNKSLKPENNSLELTILLVLIKFFGLSEKNISTLSYQMAKSGEIFDYRKNELLRNKKIIRRYPTGGVSEKIALIMPSLLKCLSKQFQFTSPFLVAKTLSFTGGTWDKLSCVPGFYFPIAGDESLSMLLEHCVCMTVTKDNFNPSDRNLYQLRSITNTVDSMPLIISSIASKQIANPVDTLMLDIRYGENAFIRNFTEANQFFNAIKSILEEYEIDTVSEFTNTNVLGGSAVGNYLEVIEAICIMKNHTEYDNFEFDKNRLNEQKRLVIEMTCKLVSKQFGVNIEEVKILCDKFFSNQEVYGEFKNLLSSHHVNKQTIKKIDYNSPFGNGDKLKKIEILALKSGIIEEIMQKRIGLFVNFTLGAGSNMFRGKNNFYNGCIIRTSENSFVKKGEILATIYTEENIKGPILANQFFKFGK